MTEWKECTEKWRVGDKAGGGDEWMADKRVKVAAEAAKPNVRTKCNGSGRGEGHARVHARSLSDCSAPKMLVVIANWVKE